MPYDAADPPLEDICRAIGDLLREVGSFVPLDRGKAMIRKWLPRDQREGLSISSLTPAQEDAIMMAADLLASLPAANGSTAFDRMAKQRPAATGPEATAIAALRTSRHRMLRHDRESPEEEVVVVGDVLSGESFHLLCSELPPMDLGTVLFARLAVLGTAIGCLAGTITPLDADALAVARGHAAAGSPQPAAAARWVEAVYVHVVRNGTLEVPGLNRSDYDDDDDLIDDGTNLLGDLAAEWAALEGPPDPALLERTAAMADQDTILGACGVSVLVRDMGQPDLAAGIERLLLTLLETVVRRERDGSVSLKLDAIGLTLDDAVAAGAMPDGSGAVFTALRQRLGGA